MSEHMNEPHIQRASNVIAASGNGVSGMVRDAWRIGWTVQADRTLSDMRKDGMSLRAIATAFGLSRQTIAQRATELGLHSPTKRRIMLPGLGVEVTPDPSVRADRDPLPAGHPFCWGLITNGTCLEGIDYVIPASSRLRRPDSVAS